MTTRSSVLVSSLLAASALLLASAQGCSLLTKSDRTRIETGGSGGTAGDGGGGQGGAGGTTEPTTGGGGAGGACPTECCSPADCPLTENNECVQRSCEGGRCGTKPVAAGVPVSTQTAGDCQEIQCDGDGGTKSVARNTDVPDDGIQCTVDACEAGVPKNTSTPAGAACSQDGGIKCDGSGACVECLTPGDCPSKVCTVAGACAPATCADGVKNGDETDIDCGGACGATCEPGDACKIAGDCASKVCSGAPLACQVPTCEDGVKNGDETGTDCGGACGPTCLPGDGCAVNEDCKGGVCTGTFCLPSCTDGIQNNGEIAVDCGGPVCTETCDDGTPCVVPSDCTSGFCVDGFCCDAACDGECAACSAALKGSGDDGVCGDAAQGTDPHGDCDVELPETCGNATGACDGAGTCEKHPAGTPCGSVATCADGLQTIPDACDGAGTCLDAGTVDCGLYACGDVACNTTCAGDADCASAAYCAAPECVEKLGLGAACVGANQCASGFCADGVCCDTACDGLCVACSAAGACTPVPSGTDPAGDCGAAGSCDGEGACKKAVGQACIIGAECQTGWCADGFCCNTPCVGLCQACSTFKKGFAPDGSCGTINVGLDPDEECPGVTTCSGGGTCTLLPQGAACAINGECQSGFCIDGVCCQSACVGFCQACSAAKTGGADGECVDVTPGTDPDGECPDEQVCAGMFSCSEP